MAEKGDSSECAICLQPLLYPTKLPCSHEFCFLCIKGIRDNPTSSKACAMCRQPFSLESIEQNLDMEKFREISQKINWFYQGRSLDGWWLFDERTASEIETAYQSKETNSLTISIAGFLYQINFDQMIQFRVSQPERVRKIKREQVTSDGDLKIKGVAGLRVTSPSEEVSSKSIRQDESVDELSQNFSRELSLNDERV